MIEFMADSVERCNNDVIVAGRLNLGDIQLGSVFDGTRQWRHKEGRADGIKAGAPPRAIHLTVVKIVAYRREIPELPCGMTGELILNGIGAKTVAADTMLTSEQSCVLAPLNS